MAHTLEHVIVSAKSGTEYDVARIVHHMYIGQFKYSGNAWYELNANGEWMKPNAEIALRLKLPTEVADAIRNVCALYQAKAASDIASLHEKEWYDNKVRDLNQIPSNLKKHSFQSRVMSQMKLLFHEREHSP